jgi:hypothetical protein
VKQPTNTARQTTKVKDRLNIKQTSLNNDKYTIPYLSVRIQGEDDFSLRCLEFKVVRGILFRTASNAENELKEHDYVKIFNQHADDFGMCRAANLATMELLECGGITSATIMPPCSWAPEACAFAKDHPQYAIGVHLTFTSEWGRYRCGSRQRM